MSRRLPRVLVFMIVLQAVHAAEEFALEFWNVFPPMRAIYGPDSPLGRALFIFFHVALIGFGVWCYRQVRQSTQHARTAMWCWVVIQCGTVAAHLIWMALDPGFQPGLVTLPLFLVTIAAAIAALKSERA